LGTREASLQSLRAGIDMICIGNNLFDQEQEMAGIAEYLLRRLREQTLDRSAITRSIERVRRRKALLA
jgi:beta-N-acetylhexosaminidase